MLWGSFTTPDMLRTARMVKAEISLLAFFLFAVLGTAVPIMIAQQRAINACLEKGPQRCQVAAIRGH